MENKQKYWLDTFNESCEIEWNKNFRNGGVAHFFEQQQAENKGYAAFIRRHIETKLFNEWLSGNKSLLEVIKYVQLLISVNEERIQQFDNRIADTNNYINTTTLVDIERINNEWNNQGIFTSARKIFNKYQSAKCENKKEKQSPIVCTNHICGTCFCGCFFVSCINVGSAGTVKN